MTPYEIGYNNTLAWLTNGKIGENCPGSGYNTEYYSEWWRGASDAYHYYNGMNSAMTGVEDLVLYAICGFLILVGAVLTFTGFYLTNALACVLGCISMSIAVYAWKKLTCSIRRRKANDSKPVN